MNQKAFSPIIILISVSVVVVLLGIIYGYFILTGKTQPAQIATQPTSVPLTQQDPIQQKVGTPECPELDYTGCDNTGDFMTWTDDGTR